MNKNRIRFHTVLVPLFSAVIFSACSPDEIDQPYWLEKGRQTLQPFKHELMSALKSGLQQGAENAVSVCQLQAPAIADHAQSPQFELGRTSHKLRNPKNAPRDWVKPLLKQYRLQSGPTGARVVALDQGRIGYVEPIEVKPVCLTCHGPDLTEPLTEKIRQAYPEDQAMGFEAGDFRGLFWVEFKP